MRQLVLREETCEKFLLFFGVWVNWRTPIYFSESRNNFLNAGLIR